MSERPWTARLAIDLGLATPDALRAAEEQAFIEGRDLLDVLRPPGPDRQRFEEQLQAGVERIRERVIDGAFERWAIAGGRLRQAALEKARGFVAAHPGTRIWEALLMDDAVELEGTPAVGRTPFRCAACGLELDLPTPLLPFAPSCPLCGWERDTPASGQWHTDRPTVADALDRDAIPTTHLPLGAASDAARAADRHLARQLADAALGRWVIRELALTDTIVSRLRASDPDAPLMDLLVRDGHVTATLARELASMGEDQLACGACGKRYPLLRALRQDAHDSTCPGCGGALRDARDPAWTPAPAPAAGELDLLALMAQGGPEAISDTRVESKQATVGRYRLLFLLGRGGMSDVYAAVDPEGEQVALKLLSVRLTDPVSVKRFEREGRLMQRVRHENVVSTLECGVDPDKRLPWIALEFVEGKDVAAIMAERPDYRLTVEEAVYVLAGAARGLGAAHSAGVIHRDVKPSNVLATPGGQIKLTDFGIALAKDVSVRLTNADEVVGTPHYIPPEVIEGADWTPAADMYALGSFAYRVLSGRLLFDLPNAIDVLYAHVDQEAPALAEVAPWVPPDLARLVHRMLAKTPAARPTPDEVVTALEHLLPEPTRIRRLWADSKPTALKRATTRRAGFKPGQEFHSYRLDEEIGRGGMGVVYRAFHRGLKKTVALKVLLHGALASEEERRRFLREAESTGALEHPNIVRVLDAGEHEGTYFITMDYVEGQRLSDWYQAEERDPPALLDLFARVCDGVHHAHIHGVVHRDLKPDNVLVDKGGAPKILDFGIAKRVDLDEGDAGTLTAEGDIIGTLRYMPPEQASGEISKVDVRSDVYALGSILYELVTGGQTPFTGSAREIMQQILLTDPRPPSLNANRRRVPWELDAICLKALEKDRDERYQSVLELRRDIDRYLQGLPIQARRATLLYRARKWAGRNRGKVAAGAVALLLVSGLMGALVFQHGASERLRRSEALAAASEGWKHVAARQFVEAQSRFELAYGLSRPGDDLPLPDEALANVPLAVREELPPRERERPRVHPERLYQWTIYARQRIRIQQAYELLEEARKAEGLGQLDRASELLRTAVDQANDEPEVREFNRRVARKFLEMGEAELARARAADPDAFDERRADLARARARFEQAKSQARPEDAERELALAALNSVEDLQLELEARRTEKGQITAARLLADDARRSLDEALEADDRAHANRLLIDAHLKLIRASTIRHAPEHDELVTRVLLAQGQLLLGDEDLAGAADKLRYAEIYQALPDEVAAFAARLARADGARREFDGFRDAGDKARGEGRWAAALGQYDLALEKRDDPAVRRKRDLCLAMLEVEAARAGRDLDAERAALLRARDLPEAPERLEAELARVDADLYDRAMEEARRLLADAQRGGGWERVLAAYERALRHRPDGPLALRGRADAWAAMRCPPGMVLVSVPARLLARGVAAAGVSDADAVRFYIERHEVTNRDFAAFVAGGGYERRELWSDEGWAARALLVDATGMHGPAGWIDGVPAAGTELLPVTGISFHEARAYALARGRRLPSEEEWLIAACLVPGSGQRRRFPWDDAPPEREPGPGRLREVGTRARDVSPWEVLDMGLNASEWVSGSHGEALVRGLSFRAFSHDIDQGVLDWRKAPRPEFRDRAIGLRCAQDVEPPPPLPPVEGSR